MRVHTLWVRHGESTWNQAGLMQGQTHHPRLTDQGRAQARAAAEALWEAGAVAIASSDLVRASDTARIIATHLALPIWYTTLLRERCWGVYEGRPVDEGQRADSVTAAEQALPHGESREDVAARLRRLMPFLAASRGPLVIVTHGDVIQEAVGLWVRDRDARAPDNGCIVGILVDQPEVDSSWRGPATPPPNSMSTSDAG